MPPKPIDYYRRPFYKSTLEKHEIQEDIALIENLAGIKRRTQAPARYGQQYAGDAAREYQGRGRGYDNDS